ncbi:LysR family transcriptional regulator [Photobacterium atrarenae]|uniref:LysR family transcriptional regulator n=1 Tax=Photobacterium atrarenae TaxID=865757 RepID=A0ABY5GPP1_9GAMM|nr:LysR family transcriptional regulator [Photobacterium atrarenae]UTV30716.1 LysR family transcriptional regulator [Photobacterium atrarenae]
MDTNLSIKQLETFRTVMRSGSVSVAARTLCRTQPAVSAMLVSLENELGFKLFERNKGRLIPKPEAFFLLEETDAILERLTRAAQLMAEVKNLSRGNLRVACMPAASLYFMPHVIADFVKDRPEVNVSMMMRSSMIVHDWVAAQQYDIGYAEMPKERESINVEPIRLKGVCAVHRDHPLAGKAVITPADLDNVPLATLFAQHPTSELVRFLFEEQGARYHPRFELQNYISGFEFVEHQLCCSICDPMSAASYTISKSGQGAVVFRPFAPDVIFEHAIITPSHKPLSRLAQAFVDHIYAGLKNAGLEEYLAPGSSTGF